METTMQMNHAETGGQTGGAARRKYDIGRPFKGLVDLYNPRIWKEKGLWWTLGVLVVTSAAIIVALGIWWSRSPARFDVRENAIALADGDQAALATGSYTAATAVRIGRTLLNKPGGYLSNDKLPPGLYLDNIPNWEFGAITALRDLAAEMRNHLSRSQSQSIEDPDLQVAHPQLNYDSDSWILPSTESEYRKGIAALESYFHRLSQDQPRGAQFFARADNLTFYLREVSTRLGSLGARLGAAAEDSGAAATVEMEELPSDAQQAREQSREDTREAPRIETPWLEVDDVFFEARGYCWALLHTMKAIQMDFRQVLVDKTAMVPMQQIIDELEHTQAMIWSPLIVNGTGFGPFPNHPLVMASYIGRANAGIIDLRNLLQQG
jgi:hypothetical protein